MTLPDPRLGNMMRSTFMERRCLKRSQSLRRYYRKQDAHPVCISSVLCHRLGPLPFAFIIGQPFKIITGKGSHSVNKVGILKPAVRNALVEEGWAVGSWEGGLVVRGRNF